MTETLHAQAQKFAESLTRTVQAVVGPLCPPFIAVEIEAASAFTVRQQPAEGIVLSSVEGPILSLAVEYRCIYDGSDRYLAVEKSDIHVFVAPGGRQPLFRYEYERSKSSKLPAAHIQFHGEHQELEKAMGECGDSTPRAKRRKRGKSQVQLSSLHFPVGGSRFRPTLEDIIEMLIEEFGVAPAGSVRAARETLAESREVWRRSQIATVVRDAPSEAVRALEELGYEVISPTNGEPPDKPTKLRAL